MYVYFHVCACVDVCVCARARVSASICTNQQCSFDTGSAFQDWRHWIGCRYRWGKAWGLRCPGGNTNRRGNQWAPMS